jgi:pyruvate carboxylase subunit B
MDEVFTKVVEPSENGREQFVSSPLEGKFYLTKEVGEKGVKVGDKIKAGEPVAYIEAMKVINVITSPYTGTIAEILVNHGAEVSEDDHLIKIV